MIIGVISDTHDSLSMVDKAVDALNDSGVSLVIHLGDYTSPFTVRRLGGLKARLIGVFGNNDGDKPSLLKVAGEEGFEIHGWPKTLELNGKKLLLIHGYGSPEDTVAFAEALASSGKWDAVLYGHTHKADVRMIEGTLLLNPGEVFGQLSGKPTIALLDLESLKAELVDLE